MSQSEDSPAAEEPALEDVAASEEAPDASVVEVVDEPPAAPDAPVPVPTATDEPADQHEPKAPPPAVGPRIIGVAPPDPPPPPKPVKPRRRRPTAAERHRRAFFARLTELRAGAQPAEDRESPALEVPEPEAIEPEAGVEREPVEAPVHEQPTSEEQATTEEAAEAEAVVEPEPEPERSATPAATRDEPIVRTARDQARLVAAIERVGGAAVVRQALAPKRDNANKPIKWAAVCCEAAQGLKPGDPVFAAWVRLAATPVREIKSKVPDERPPARGGRGGGDRGGQGRGGPRRDDRQGGRGRDDRGGREGRASREDMAKHAYGGRVGAKIVIPGFEPPQD